MGKKETKTKKKKRKIIKNLKIKKNKRMWKKS